MTTKITFSRQNDADSRVSNTYYWENLVLVVFLVSESKALFILTAKTGYEDNNARLPEQIADLIISNFSCRALKSVAWITG